MALYQISSKAGESLGTYKADSVDAAVDAMHADAGYSSTGELGGVLELDEAAIRAAYDVVLVDEDAPRERRALGWAARAHGGRTRAPGPRPTSVEIAVALAGAVFDALSTRPSENTPDDVIVDVAFDVVFETFAASHGVTHARDVVDARRVHALAKSFLDLAWTWDAPNVDEPAAPAEVTP
jgi:hypothetical protein